MNVLFVSDYKPSPQCGGIERMISLLSELYSNELQYNCFLTYFRESPDGQCGGKFSKILFRPSESELEIFIVDNSIDIVVNHILSKQSIKFFLPKINNICSKLHIRNLFVFHTIPGFERLFGMNIPFFAKQVLLRNKYRRITNNVDEVILLSDSYKTLFRKISGDNNIRLSDIPNPAIIHSKIDKCSKEHIALVVARMDECTKRISRIIKIWNKADVADWKLVIVGNGPDLEMYKSMARNNHSISFEGQQVPDEYYKKASLFLMTSEFEGFPMTLLECQMFGVVPIAYGSFSSIYDVIDNGKSGFIIKNKNAKKFTEVLQFLIKNENRISEMSKYAMDYINKFSKDEILKKWEEKFN